MPDTESEPIHGQVGGLDEMSREEVRTQTTYSKLSDEQQTMSFGKSPFKG